MSDQTTVESHAPVMTQTAHGHWPHRWWHYPLMPVVVLFRMRPSASAKSWFVWGTFSSLVHAVLIVVFFGLADQVPDYARAWFITWYPLIGGIITWLQVKSIGTRPPGEEAWDKIDNRTSYVPILAIIVVIAIFVTRSAVLHYSFAHPWDLSPFFVNLLPRSIGEWYPIFLASIFLALSDAGMIDIQYLISRGLSRVTPR